MINTFHADQINLIVLDLDDTLYDESDYVMSGFLAVAKAFSQELAVSSADLHTAMVTAFHQQGRGAVFNQALMTIGIEPISPLIEAMVLQYRAHLPDIQLFNGVLCLLKELKKKFRLALVTDGLTLMQRNKVAALNIAYLFDEIRYCWECGAPKPATAAYLSLAGFDPNSSIIVGDNPEHDGQAAKALGVPFVRVLTGRFQYVDGGDLVLPSVLDLPSVLRHDV